VMSDSPATSSTASSTEPPRWGYSSSKSVNRLRAAAFLADR
jgi:hypothetical protein